MADKSNAEKHLEIAKIIWYVAYKNNEKMDTELASAKNKTGVFMKYKNLIAPRAWDVNYVDPFDNDEPGTEAAAWVIGALAIGMDMRDRLQAFASQNGVVLNG